MNALQVVVALACVSLISIGQLLFRMVGVSINDAGTAFSIRPLAISAAAFSIYGLATIGWIFLLRSVPLSKAYPYMALSFCIVPLLGVMLMQEKLSTTYPLGVILIVCGVILVGR